MSTILCKRFKFLKAVVSQILAFLIMSEASIIKVLLEILQNSRENTCARVSFLIKLQAEVISCEFCEISKNTFFTDTFGRLLLDYLKVISN